MTLADLVRAFPALTRLSAPRIPATTAYHLARLTRLVRPEVQHFEEAQQALIKQYGAERPVTPEEATAGMTGPVTAVLPEHLETYMAAITELLAVPAVIDAWLLTPALIDPLTASGADMEALLPLFAPDAPVVNKEA